MRIHFPVLVLVAMSIEAALGAEMPARQARLDGQYPIRSQASRSEFRAREHEASGFNLSETAARSISNEGAKIPS